jgi:hypothetical protein
MSTVNRHWLAVASGDHVAHGLAGGFMQVCHGKAAPLRRIQPGDGVVYYSPSRVFGAADGFRSFTAIGIVCEGEPYCFDMGGGFVPFRREVAWRTATSAPAATLLDRLDLTRGRRNWGYQLRFGLIALGISDFETIGAAMSAEPARQTFAEAG